MPRKKYWRKSLAKRQGPQVKPPAKKVQSPPQVKPPAQKVQFPPQVKPPAQKVQFPPQVKPPAQKVQFPPQVKPPAQKVQFPPQVKPPAQKVEFPNQVKPPQKVTNQTNMKQTNMKQTNMKETDSPIERTGDYDDCAGDVQPLSKRLKQSRFKQNGSATEYPELDNVSTEEIICGKSHEPVSSIMGTFNQGDVRFGENRGRQCVANSLSCILYNQVKDIDLWNSGDLDTVLTEGNELYKSIRHSQAISEIYLLVTEIPSKLSLFEKTYTISMGNSLTGILSDSFDPDFQCDFLVTLSNALRSTLSDFNSCLITFAVSTFAIIKRNRTYFVFDSHSRDNIGTQVHDGKSVLNRYGCIEEVYEHCQRLARSMNVSDNTQFEMTGINVEVLLPRMTLEAGNDQSLSMDEVTFVSSEQIIYPFEPLSEELCANLCNNLGLICQTENLQSASSVHEMGKPCSTKTIMKDGNCFFRALSYVISGSEKHHRKIRLSVVKHMKENTDFVNVLRSPYRAVDEYIKQSRMNYVGTWATEVEIFAAADLFNINIYVFSNRWLKYSWTKTPLTNVGVYMKHCDQCHYEVVSDVEKHINLASESLYQNEVENIQNPLKLTTTDTPECLVTPGKNKRERRKYWREYIKLKRSRKDCVGRMIQTEERKTVEKMRQKRKYNTDEIYKETKKRRSMEKYDLDKKHRESVKSYSVNKYAHDVKHRETVKSYSVNKYADDLKHRETVKSYSVNKYAHDEKHRENAKSYSVNKYAHDEKHRETAKSYSVNKYAHDEKHRETAKSYSVNKYAHDEKHRETAKSYSVNKYAHDQKHRDSVKSYSIHKYAHDPHFKANLKKAIQGKRFEKQIARKKFENALKSFRKLAWNAPNHVCSVCNRRLFAKQVLGCRKEGYVCRSARVKSLAARCISDRFVHVCSPRCHDQCFEKSSPAGKTWICYTCHRKIISGKLPAEAEVNNLNLAPIPNELNCLNSLERHLISLHIPFSKVINLRRGNQKAAHGPVVCVPSNVQGTVTALPRREGNDQLIRVKLKRKLSYKGHVDFKFVNKVRIEKALQWLIKANKWYTGVTIDNNWTNADSDMNVNGAQTEHTLSDLKEVEEVNESEPDISDHGMYMDSCLQPVDIGQEVLDQHFDNIMCLAPAEGNDPVKLLMDETNEGKSFPVLFPSGSPTYHDDREAKITIARYLHTRLMLADSRFAKSTDYIFYAQYLSEVYQVLSSVSIALRKSFCQIHGEKVSPQQISDGNYLEKTLKQDHGYKFLKPIRGTPSFWQAAQKDLFAMIRQLGIPTWFCSFSSGDTRWREVIQTILREENDSRDPNELDWSEKCAMLRKNPVTAARMFDNRFHSFLKEVIMSPAEPIGKIVDYFYRVEFQQRGSPHTHCLFWVENAPKLDTHTDEDIAHFVDAYVTCDNPPTSDEELHEIVNSVQMHSKRHSDSCRKKGTTCRFNFPRQPSKQTFVSRPIDITENTKEMVTDPPQHNEFEDIDKAEAKQILEKLWKTLQDTEHTFKTTDELFHSIGIDQNLLEAVCNKLSRKANLVIRRNPNDVWVNQYNENLLRCWNANMDIQYVLDAYSCVVYIISYISKAEREMGMLLDRAQKEALKGNENAKDAMKKLGSVYLHNREVSAQEAVFRVCNLRLKECSRKVLFIPTGENPVRMTLPISVIKTKSNGEDLDVEDIWMTSSVDRYKNRPHGVEVDDLCLASFCSEYRVLTKCEIKGAENKKHLNPVHVLQNDLGCVQKRSRTKPAIVRYARFQQSKEPEKYFQSILQLFLPYRTERHLKPEQFETFQNFFESGAVKRPHNNVESVRNIVERNKAMFESNADELEMAEKALEQAGPLDDAWAQICPESEVERHLRTEKNANSHDNDDIPDLFDQEKPVHSVEIRQCVLPRNEAQNLLRSLNQNQRQVFYKVREWCLQRSYGSKPDPFYLFITGGAGTGKSHLIKCIQYEASRLLAPSLPNPDDVSVLLTAPTGVSAFNIGANTIHTTFCIGVDAKLPYQPLGDEKVNTLRAKFGSIQILIVDEISMVDQKLITYIHGRLRQIKQCRDFSPFGKVSVIAVGDFYQLAPVKGKPLYADTSGVNLWTDLFQSAELTQIMRQKDREFAEMLNRLRKHKKTDVMKTDDVIALQNRETGEDSDALHICATNAEVDTYNLTKLQSSCSDLVTIDAEDFYKDAKTAKLEKRESQYIKVFNTTLTRRITLAKGARVMLTKNVDVSDGLVNGVFGSVSHIEKKTDGNFPDVVYIVFDNAKVGEKLRKKTKIPVQIPESSTPVLPQEDRVTNSGGVRRQFPLKLAYACSIHKVQGTTLNKVVVSLEKIFSAGQAYVALSRVTSLNGLIIKNFRESAIYSNEKVTLAMESMPSFIPSDFAEVVSSEIILHNIQGIHSHIEDVKTDERFLQSNFVCFTETWLPTDGPLDLPELNNFTFHHKPRYSCYDSNEPMFADLQQQKHGGVGFYHKADKHCEILELSVKNLEHIAFYTADLDVVVVIIYRPPSYPLGAFKETLECLLDELDKTPRRYLLVGDFNEDLFQYSSVITIMEERNFTQYVAEPTTEGHTLIDHVYGRGFDRVATKVFPTYYSYHEAISIYL